MNAKLFYFSPCGQRSVVFWQGNVLFLFFYAKHQLPALLYVITHSYTHRGETAFLANSFTRAPPVLCCWCQSLSTPCSPRLPLSPRTPVGIQGVEATPFPLSFAVTLPPTRTASTSNSWTKESNFRNTTRQTNGVFWILFTKQRVERIRHLPHSKYYAYLPGMITTQPTTDFWGETGAFTNFWAWCFPSSMLSFIRPPQNGISLGVLLGSHVS